MKRLLFMAILLLSLTQALEAADKQQQPSHGRALFELLGMLDEYMGRHIDGKTVESFGVNEKNVADRFEKVLREYCEEEGLKPDFQKQVDPSAEAIIFTSPVIAASLNNHFTNPRGDEYGGSYLDPVVFKDATQADLLRYVEGAYERFGRDKGRAVIYMANESGKAEAVGEAMANLGCTRVRIYASVNTSPTSTVLLFSPSPVVRDALDIRSEPAPEQLGFHAKLELVKTVVK
jgi:hypothetical protein